MNHEFSESIVGCLLGTALGDALGLPMEGLSRRRQSAMFPDLTRFHFFFGRGMISDDTEHAGLVAEAVAVSGGRRELFAAHLARGLRWWLLSLPAGVGWATLRSILKLWVGFGYNRSGVYSAGNGPAMRSPLLGVLYGADRSRLIDLVRISTRLTHSDPKAEQGALAVAWAAYLAGQHREEPRDFLDTIPTILGPNADELSGLLGKAADSAASGQSTADFAADLGLERGVTGYMFHTVPVVIQAWLRHPGDFRTAIASIIRCGGDADTTAAILGGIIGAAVGRAGLPSEYFSNLWLWPKTISWFEQMGPALAQAVETEVANPGPPYPWWGVWPRNLFFLMVVLTHGFRRLLPPY
ncbi:MAG: ADP-ribosylglycohydrolase family protein [Deltaproteobacteria bacterium]|nr:ADP-ribosylglycohydrolase family protein [Deltaproteobacteria bacterium]